MVGIIYFHYLDGDVHNGSEAMNIYPMIAAMSADEQERARQSLLKYCAGHLCHGKSVGEVERSC